MPFLSYRCGIGTTIQNAGLLIRAGAQAVKLEGASGNLDTVRSLVEAGIPVMGHLGLTPQSIHQLGGFRVQARDAETAKRLEDDARDLEQAGCFGLVLEAVPSDVAARVTSALSIPTIGIGAGSETDGQILVLHDLLGLSAQKQPKFVREFFDGSKHIKEALARFHTAVESGDFPDISETYQ
jgi:3-methyl-2-oxobutanoate hydroxymethyltransferase